MATPRARRQDVTAKTTDVAKETVDLLKSVDTDKLPEEVKSKAAAFWADLDNKPVFVGYVLAALVALYGVEFVADLPLLSLVLPKVRAATPPSALPRGSGVCTAPPPPLPPVEGEGYVVGRAANGRLMGGGRGLVQIFELTGVVMALIAIDRYAVGKTSAVGKDVDLREFFIKLMGLPGTK